MKYREIRPQEIPKRTQAGRRWIDHSLSRWKVNKAASPLKIYVKQVAVTHDTRIGKSDDMVISIMSTSRVKTSPAIGALKMPAIAPAAPQPTSVNKVFRSRWNILPRFEPIAEPVSTIGASAPTEPPKPIVMAEAMTDDHVV
jgi:hypothetical protein